jgi:predicted nucleic acid-binding protein
MAVLLDTNILLRLAQPTHPHASLAEAAVCRLRARNETLNIVSQNLVEFWAVATRSLPDNGLGLTPEQVMSDLQGLKRLFNLLPELPLQDAWEALVLTHRISGKNTHDARLVAAMMVHRIDSILTFNIQDFIRYNGIAVLDPRTLT